MNWWFYPSVISLLSIGLWSFFANRINSISEGLLFIFWTFVLIVGNLVTWLVMAVIQIRG